MIAELPPMGWNSWNAFGKSVNEQVIKETADALVSTGLRDLGYRYLVIDDHWHGGRDKNGLLVPHPVKFPSGMKSLADYIHARGLKFGMYSDAGEMTCGREVGSLGFEQQDAATFASWDVDFLKYDYCYAPDNRKIAEQLYTKMGLALKATGRPILYSICEWGSHQPWEWAAQAGGSMWRATGDIWDGWYSGPRGEDNGIDRIGFEEMRGLEPYSGPGHWNDPDMLVVGLRGRGSIQGPGCTDVEYRTHFSVWCMLAAPLFIGCDLRTIDPVSLETLSNRELIAIDQDPLGRQGGRVNRRGLAETWVKPLMYGELAVGLFNRSTASQVVNADWSDLGLEGEYRARDLWLQEDVGVFQGSISSEVEGHGCRILRLTPA